ncbi:NAD-dependent epimerase/dehydratase family protein [Halarsenatibacter silvermanii]|uniref:UDP-glucose 4-epimerase n=1 Tax=Halarsenatibacter silvermanii TaxID=321763 RepID=A0A1G9LWB7_9FIRM|nr:NAD-dependent epimerase/dehydratase family protein [Halarsenatibacter silvermanii]SDL66246.1 UDP-glucose 4-epimerase [Halarsenatibacter silvermanii]
MKALVTGAAGFIGSHLAEKLVAEGMDVLGIDNFSDYYDRRLKDYNLRRLRDEDNFSLLEADLLEQGLPQILADRDLVFHQAAQAGVRASWGEDFQIYSDSNVLATQRLLEAANEVGIDKFVYASSSSVYGETEDLPMQEDGRTRPVSPYGVTKLAGENLCQLYHHNFGLPVVSLRYFTVYGERQRPDMAFHIFIKSILQCEPITIFGDGQQSRNFTYIEDAVTANLLAARTNVSGEVFNIGGPDGNIELNRAVDIIEEKAGQSPGREYQGEVDGDVRHTAADCSKAAEMLGYEPKTGLEAGIEAEVEYIREVYDL